MSIKVTASPKKVEYVASLITEAVLIAKADGISDLEIGLGLGAGLSLALNSRSGIDVIRVYAQGHLAHSRAKGAAAPLKDPSVSSRKRPT